MHIYLCTRINYLLQNLAVSKQKHVILKTVQKDNKYIPYLEPVVEIRRLVIYQTRKQMFYFLLKF